MDVIDLSNFYASRLGQVARRLVAHRLHHALSPVKGGKVLGLGYAQPYLDLAGKGAKAVFSFMPAQIGVNHWPQNGPNRTALVDETHLPLEDASIDFALLVHCAELSHHLPDMLAEVWRVLAGQGRLAIVVPNRRGMWARFDHTPFGHGRPFSRSQITKSLRDAMLIPSGYANALFMPPIERRFALRSAPALERAGLWVSPGFSGVLIVEATKQVYAVGRRRASEARVPELVPQGAGALPRAVCNPLPARKTSHFPKRGK